ncbi:MAG TPA: transglutaminase domain-containing protein [Gemmatimonadales bacterium]
MNRRVVGTTLVGVWLACLGWLAARELGPGPEGSAPRATVRLAPGAAFYAVTLAGRQIGTAGVTLDTTTVGYRLTEVMALDLPAGSGRRRDVMRAEASLTRSLHLASAQTSVSEGGRGQTLEAEAREDSSLVLRIRRERTELDRIVLTPPEVPLTVPGAIPLRLAAGRLLRPRGEQAAVVVDILARVVRGGPVRVGMDSVFIVADSATLDPATARFVPVAGDSVRAWRLERPSDAGLPMVDWVDARGQVIRREHAFGIVIERSPFEVNYTNYQTALRQSPAAEMAVPAGARRSIDDTLGRPVATALRRVVVSRWDGPAWAGSVEALAGGRQQVVGDTVEIRPYPGGGESTTASPHRRNTAPTAAADERILATALSEALTGTTEGGDTLPALARWVARAVQYVDSDGAPTGSLTVARTRRGGVEGKVALLVALAELAGYRARPVYGVDVSRDPLPAHQWVEVWRNGWEAVDPVFGEAPASTTLLRIGEGASMRPLVMVPQVGGLRVRMLP